MAEKCGGSGEMCAEGLIPAAYDVGPHVLVGALQMVYPPCPVQLQLFFPKNRIAKDVVEPKSAVQMAKNAPDMSTVLCRKA